MKLPIKTTKKHTHPSRETLIHALRHTIEAGMYGAWMRDRVWEMNVFVPAIIDVYQKKYAKKHGPLVLKDGIWYKFRDAMQARPANQSAEICEDDKNRAIKMLQKMIRCEEYHAERIVTAYVAVHQTLPPFTPLAPEAENRGTL